MKKFLLLLFLFNFSFLFAQTAEEYFEKAEIATQKGETKKAIKFLKKGLDIEPSVAAYYSLMDRYRILNNYEDFYKTVNNALAEFPNHSNFYNERGIFHHANGFYDYALRDYNLCLKFAKNDTVKLLGYMNRGVTKFVIRDFEGAYADYIKAYELDSTNIGALNNLALVCDEVGRDDEVLDYLFKVLDLDSTFMGSYLNIGFKYQLDEEYEKSIPYFDKAIKLAPEIAESYNNRGYSKLKLGDLKGALADVNKSIEMYPQNSYAFRNRALIYLEKGKTKKACEDIKTALDYGFTEQYGDEVIELQRKYCR